MKTRLNKREISALQKQAAKMVVVDGLLQKDVAAKLGITPKTVSKWAIKFKWHEAAERSNGAATKFYVDIEDFGAYVKAGSEDAYKTLKQQLDGYIEAVKPVQRVFLGLL